MILYYIYGPDDEMFRNLAANEMLIVTIFTTVMTYNGRIIQEKFLDNVKDGNVLALNVVSYHNSKINTLRSRQNGRRFPDDNFKCIFFNENEWIYLEFVP